MYSYVQKRLFTGYQFSFNLLCSTQAAKLKIINKPAFIQPLSCHHKTVLISNFCQKVYTNNNINDSYTKDNKAHFIQQFKLT